MLVEFKPGGFTPKVVNNICFVAVPKTDKVIGGSLMCGTDIVAGIAYNPQYYDSDGRTPSYCKVHFTETCLCAGRLCYADDTMVFKDENLDDILNYLFKKN